MKKKDVKTAKAEEPLPAYNTMSYTSPLVVVMGGKSGNGNPSDFDLVNQARKGISKKTLVALAKQVSLTMEEIASILHISERTLQRYTPSTLVRTEYADRAIELGRLYERGIDVLGSAPAFNHWMRSPNYGLNNEVPLSLLDTSIGFDILLDVLGRIEHGIFN